MHAYDGDAFLDIPTREGKPRERGLTHVMDKGLNLREIEGLFDTAASTSTSSSSAGARATSRTTSRRRSPSTARSRPRSSAAARSSRRSTGSPRWTSSSAGSSTSASPTSRSRTARSTSRATRSSSSSPTSPATSSSSPRSARRTEVNIAPYLWVQWMREELDAGVEGDRRGPPRAGGTAGIYRPTGELRTWPRRRDRALDLVPRPHLGGADQGLASVVRPALRPGGEPREHPARRGHRARDAPSRASRRHAEGGASWPSER